MASAFPVLMGLVPGVRVLIAGGTGTIGSAVVQAMLKQGAKVVVASRAEGRFRRLVRDTPKVFHDNLVSIRADLTKEEGVKHIFENAVKPNRDRIKHVVACLRADMTPYNKVKMFDQTLPELYSVAREEIRCHYLLMKTFIPYLEKYQTGTTYTVVTGFPHSEVEKFGVYIPMSAMANAALQGMVKAARAEYRENKVSINEANIRLDISKEPDEELRKTSSLKVGHDLIGKAITAIVASEIRSRIIIRNREDAMKLAGLPYLVDKREQLLGEACAGTCKDDKGTDPNKNPQGGLGAAAAPEPSCMGKINLQSQTASAAATQKAAGKRAVPLFEASGQKKKESDTVVSDLSKEVDPFAPTHGYVPPPEREKVKKEPPKAEQDITMQSLGFIKKMFQTDSQRSPPPRAPSPVAPPRVADKINLVPERAEDSPRTGTQTPAATLFGKPAGQSIRTEPLYKSGPELQTERTSHPTNTNTQDVAKQAELKAQEAKKDAFFNETLQSRQEEASKRSKALLQATLSQYTLKPESRGSKSVEASTLASEFGAFGPEPFTTQNPPGLKINKHGAPPTTADVLKTRVADPVTAMAADILKSGPVKTSVTTEAVTDKASEAVLKARADASAGKNKDSLKEKTKDTVPNQVHNFVHPAFIKDQADKTTKTPVPAVAKAGIIADKAKPKHDTATQPQPTVPPPGLPK